ncbi:hypothetical protein HY251_07620 [bacterium]|nr:hypothetical protein [bacterium]
MRELAGAQAITDPGAPADGKQPPPPPPPPPPSGNPPGQDAPPPPKRGILWLEQLLAIDGLDPKVLYGDPKADPPKKGIAPFVTCWCTDALNLNTMPPEVLYAVLPQYNNSTPQGDVWGAADEIVKGIQKYRIDPDYQTAPPATTTPASPGAAPPPPPPPATTPSNPDQQQQGSGASGKWTGKAFETVGELQSPQIHALLGTIFESAPPAGGSGPATPPPPPAPGTPVTFKAMLATESRLYAIVVKATNGEGATKTLRMVVARNSADEVAPLFVREDPR